MNEKPKSFCTHVEPKDLDGGRDCPVCGGTHHTGVDVTANDLVQKLIDWLKSACLERDSILDQADFEIEQAHNEHGDTLMEIGHAYSALVKHFGSSLDHASRIAFEDAFDAAQSDSDIDPVMIPHVDDDLEVETDDSKGD